MTLTLFCSLLAWAAEEKGCRTSRLSGWIRQLWIVVSGASGNGARSGFRSPIELQGSPAWRRIRSAGLAPNSIRFEAGGGNLGEPHGALTAWNFRARDRGMGGMGGQACASAHDYMDTQPVSP